MASKQLAAINPTVNECRTRQTLQSDAQLDHSCIKNPKLAGIQWALAISEIHFDAALNPGATFSSAV